MPLISQLEYKTKKRHLFHRRVFSIASLVVAIVIAIPLAVILNSRLASAATLLSNVGPNPPDFTYNNGQNEADELFIVSNNGYDNIPETNIKLYFSQRTGNTLTIMSPGTSAQDVARGYDSLTSGANPDITACNQLPKQMVATFLVTSPVGQVATRNANCNDTANLVIPIPAADLTATPDAQTGYYQALLTVTINRANTIQDGFKVAVATANNTTGKPPVVGYDGAQDSQTLGLGEAYPQPHNDNGHYTDDQIKFGSDCSVTANSPAVSIGWFDADNGEDLVQPIETSFHLVQYDRNNANDPLNNTDVVFTGINNLPQDTDNSKFVPGTRTEIIPGTDSNAYGSASFIPNPVMRYDWVWDGAGTTNHGVYINNTLEVSVPFDGIYYNEGCQVPVTPPYQLQALISGPSTTTILNPGENSDSAGSFSAAAQNLTTTTSDKYTEAVQKVAPPAGVVNAGPDVTFTDPGAPILDDGSLIWRDQNRLVGDGRTTPLTFKFQVGANAPEGSEVCFQSKVNPSDPSGDISLSSSICYKIEHQYEPGIVATGGDVHAGGGVGNLTACTLGTPNDILANDSSYGQYVVSAMGTITPFGSNNSITGGTISTLGNGTPLGGYGGADGSSSAVCRPNLYAEAQDYATANPTGIITLPQGSYSIAYLTNLITSNPTKKPAIYVDGTLTITGGSVTGKMTVIATNVIIAGDITYGTTPASTSYTNQPSLGIITSDEINIQPTAAANETVDAFLYAAGAINTCYITGGAAPTKACFSTLTVNGFMMGKSLSLNRFGPITGASNTTIGEQVNLAAQLYTNPPAFFDNSSSQLTGGLESLGERAPLN